MPNIKHKKEKPQYNVAQNCAYIIKRVWVHKKSVLFVMLAQAIIAVAFASLILYMPKQIIMQITAQNGVGAIIITTAFFAGAITLLNAVKTYFEHNVHPARTGLRLLIVNEILMKIMQTDYINLESKAFNLAKEKAQQETGNNTASTQAVYYTMTELMTNLLGFAVYIAVLASVNPFVLLLTGATALIAFFAQSLANKWRYEHDAELMAHGQKLYFLTEASASTSYAKDLRLFAMTPWLNNIYNSVLALFYDIMKRTQRKLFFADAIGCLAAFFREGIAYTYLIYQVLSFGLTLDSFVLLFAAVGGFSVWITGILTNYAELSRHSLNYCIIRKFLEYPDTFKREDGEAPEKASAYSLIMKNVSFKYPGADEYVLENVNLTITAGERLAVVGLNGAGKTTLVKLLCGFYNPTQGQILLNGKDIRLFDRRKYYELFTAVFQEFNILPVTIAENVAQQLKDDIDYPLLQKSLERAGILQRINRLVQRENSLLIKSVHEDAAELSGGETQRLMLARALYKNAPVLILDEPTAALDAIAESELYEKYNELSSGKTSVYISHRLASTRFCDRIILIENKGISECGTHAELLCKGGKYAELFEMQSEYYKDGKTKEAAI